MAIALLASTAMLSATTVTKGGMTLQFPSYSAYTGTGLLHCEPWDDPSADDITFTGVPTNVSSIRLQFIFSNGAAPLTFSAPLTLTNFGDGNFSVTIPYPRPASAWPGHSADGSSTIVASVSVAVTRADGTTMKFSSAQWKVRCIPDEGDEPLLEGCTPGYWNQFEAPNDQHLHAWTEAGYSPSDSYNTVFGVTSSLNPPGPPPAIANPTLGQAVSIGGGGENAMARHAVAALLNAAHPGVDYPMTVAEIIATVQAAYATGNFEAAHQLFEGYNELVTTRPDGSTYHCGLS
jgi:hypothetical protein